MYNEGKERSYSRIQCCRGFPQLYVFLHQHIKVRPILLFPWLRLRHHCLCWESSVQYRNVLLRFLSGRILTRLFCGERFDSSLEKTIITSRGCHGFTNPLLFLAHGSVMSVLLVCIWRNRRSWHLDLFFRSELYSRKHHRNVAEMLFFVTFWWFRNVSTCFSFEFFL